MLAALIDARLEILEQVPGDGVARRADELRAAIRQAAKLERLKLPKPLHRHLDQRVVQSTLRGMTFPTSQILRECFWHRFRSYHAVGSRQPRSVAPTGLGTFVGSLTQGGTCLRGFALNYYLPGLQPFAASAQTRPLHLDSRTLAFIRGSI